MSNPPADSPGPAYLIGVEGGGTKTVAWLARVEADEFEILGRGTSGPSNIHAIGLNLTLAHLWEAIHKARIDGRLPEQTADALCLAMAGVDRPQEARLFADWARSQNIAHRVQVTNDCEGLLAAGTSEGWGVALVSGTGSITFGRSPQGETTRTGGWGYLMGDEGSAYTVALAGLKSAVRSADGREPPGRLLPDYLDRLELQHADDLLQAIYLNNPERAWIASLADVVTKAAEEGDPAANRILSDAAAELAHLIATTARKLRLETGPLPICYTGGLILNSPPVQERIVKELVSRDIEIAEYVAVPDPIWGALRIARRSLEGL